MIEWVEFEPGIMPGEAEVLVIVRKGRFSSVSTAKLRTLYGYNEYEVAQYGYFCIAGLGEDGFYISHVAKINLPPKKTLEEKIAKICEDFGLMCEEDICATILEVVKHHYEGEK